MAEAKQTMLPGDDRGAFVDRFELRPPSPSPSHLPLRGLTFAVKEIFDVARLVTGFGNPDWKRTHTQALSTAPAVLSVLGAGASCAGRTVMDEMAYSISGENMHYGTPRNPCAPGRVPGGSSSGSAVAVAAGLVDFSLGTDTGGSVRVPAAYCGIFGFRPSHGVVSAENVIPMAQSFDTVGWFARDISTLSHVGQALLPSSANKMKQPTHIVIPKDCFEVLSIPDDHLYAIANTSAGKTYHCPINNANLGELIVRHVPSIGSLQNDNAGSTIPNIPALAALSHTMRSIQRTEFGTNHGDWIIDVKPRLAPEIDQRVMEAVASRHDNIDHHRATMGEFQAMMVDLLGDSGILIIPTVPGAPPELSIDPAASNNYRSRAFSLLSIAGLSGSCQIVIPLGIHDDVPVSISILARHGADHFLLDVAQGLHSALKEHAAAYWKS